MDFQSWVNVGVGWWLIDSIIVCLAYLLGQPGVYGKKQSGLLPIWSWMLFLPWHAFTYAVWHLDRRFNSGGWQWINENLAVGRRPLAGEVPMDFDHFIDLTAEFSENLRYRQLPGYICFPLLDATAPQPASLLELVRRVHSGKTFVHCAKGHGRTGLVALAILLETGRVASLEEGLQIIQFVRPGVQLNRSQRRCLEQFRGLITSCHPVRTA